MRSSAGDPALLPVNILSTEIGARRLASIDLVDGLLERIRAADPKLHAFVEVYAEDARFAAEAADKAIRSGHSIGAFDRAVTRDPDRAQGPDRD
jgi:aspartyl-tRNA(Asn)/glutamyl-tRNA(Gln) amidotransferase subunit A